MSEKPIYQYFRQNTANEKADTNNQNLNDYINNTRREPGTALVYNIKWQDDIGNAEEILLSLMEPIRAFLNHLKTKKTTIKLI